MDRFAKIYCIGGIVVCVAFMLSLLLCPDCWGPQ